MLGTIFLFLWLFAIFASLVQAIRGKMPWSAALAIIGGLALYIILSILACSDGSCPDFANYEWP